MSLLTPILRTSRPFACCRRNRILAMPLKAKIIDAPRREFRQTARQNSRREEMLELVEEQPGDEEGDVIFSQLYGLRTIELNRPKKLNSLNGSMARKILGRISEWQQSDLANIIVIQGRGRAFCAGGDVAALAKWNREGEAGAEKSSEYFALEYKLDHLIACCTKPYIAYMDGITMGGGVGLSLHAPFRIATENTVFAMPETTIGFFPDVGGSFFLPRMDGNMGTYLALTSEQLKGVDVFYHGIATHFIHSTSLPSLSERLSQLHFSDTLPLPDRLSLIDSTLAEFSTGLPTPRPQITGSLRRTIDTCFSPTATSPLDILAALSDVQAATKDEAIREWANKTIKTMRERSPIAVAVTLEQMKRGKDWTIGETFRREHGIASEFMRHPDFTEGVTARLIQRTKARPDWNPNTLEDVTSADVEKFFKRKVELGLLVSGEKADYSSYPYADLGLPTEREVLEERGVGGGRRMKEEVVQIFLGRRGEKVGVREKVEEVVERFEEGEREEAAREGGVA